MAAPNQGSIWPTTTASWAAWTALLLVLPFGEGGTGLETALGFNHWDKVVHVVLFGVLAWLLRRSFRELGYQSWGLLAAVVSTAYGGLLELVQVPIPYRGGGLGDLAADAAGAFAAVTLAGLVTASRRPVGMTDC